MLLREINRAAAVATRKTLRRQIERWGLPPERTQAITYDAQGNIYYGFR